jgi:hypothetical protein
MLAVLCSQHAILLEDLDGEMISPDNAARYQGAFGEGY